MGRVHRDDRFLADVLAEGLPGEQGRSLREWVRYLLEVGRCQAGASSFLVDCSGWGLGVRRNDLNLCPRRTP